LIRTSVELVAIANPMHSNFRDVVERDQIVVPWHAMDGFDARLVEASEQIL